MPFDPNQPNQGAPLSSAVMRSQLNGLKAIIDAIPAGPPGPAGPIGPPGEVTTAALDAGLAATLAQTSANSNAVAFLNELAEGSYNQQQMQNLITKVDELINALRR